MSRVDAKDLWAWLVREGLYNNYDGFKDVMDLLEKAWTSA